MKTFSSKNMQCEVKSVCTAFPTYCLSFESELVLCLHLISPRAWGIVFISAYCLWYVMLILAWIHLILITAYCLWYLMPIQMSLIWLCAHAWYHCLPLFNLIWSTDTTVNGPKYIELYKVCLEYNARHYMDFLAFTIFYDLWLFCCKNVLCVAECYRHDIAMNLQHQNCRIFALCVSWHLVSSVTSVTMFLHLSICSNFQHLQRKLVSSL